MIWVTDASYVDGYRIEVEFSDGGRGEVDLKDAILNDHREIVRELKDLAQFKCFRVDMDTVVWDNGFDLAPEFLYEHAKRNKAA